MEDTSLAAQALVPTVKPDHLPDPGTEPPPDQMAPESVGGELDKDTLCPICMQIITDAFLTACGHSFCYTCIVTHLRNKSDCPCCAHYLTTNHIFPNFLLDKLLKKNSARQVAKSASPFEHLRQAIQQGCEVSIKELNGLLSLLAKKKRKMEQEEAETKLQILLDFLHCLRKQKLEEMNEIQADLLYIKEDINAVKRYRTELYRAKERFSVKLRMLNDDPIAAKARASLTDMHGSGIISSPHCLQGQMGPQNKKADLNAQVSLQVFQRKDGNNGSDLQSVAPSALALARKKWVHSQFNDLQECYLQKRRNWSGESHNGEESNTNPIKREGYHPGLDDFQSIMTTFTRYSRLRVIAELRHDDLFHPANIVSSIEFDRDDEFFATAGVSRRIKVFEFSTVVNEPADVHCPVAEMSSRSKLSCLSWNKYTKNYIASSDYEGIVTVWDITNRQSVMEYEEHEKRAWSVDFSCTEPSMLVSGSDDCKVKIWCTKQEASVLNINMTANICSVKFNPGSNIHVALHTYRSHTNEKSFVGLTANSEFICCGSETNRVFVYHKAISRPMAWHKLGSLEGDDDDSDGVNDDDESYFISAVCWKSNSPTVLAANSEGKLKVLVLA
ncbi:hypothetical protein I3760_09G097600 [Carya illinoinensis]|nr:hypothetical protein I3760_09G097600 [Carya illinoinensis]